MCTYHKRVSSDVVCFCYDSLFQNYLIDCFSKNKIGYWCIIFIIVIGYNVMELQPIICLCTCHAYALVRCVQVFEDICTTLESFKISQRLNYFNICNCRFFILCIFYFAHIHTYIHGPVASKHGNRRSLLYAGSMAYLGRTTGRQRHGVCASAMTRSSRII